jgi:hypothetical protein
MRDVGGHHGPRCTGLHSVAMILVFQGVAGLPGLRRTAPRCTADRGVLSGEE